MSRLTQQRIFEFEYTKKCNLRLLNFTIPPEKQSRYNDVYFNLESKPLSTDIHK